MQSIVEDKPLQDISLAQRHPARPLASEILVAVSAAYNRPEALVLDRSFKSAFHAWVYLFRRTANQPLKEVASMAGKGHAYLKFNKRSNKMSQSRMALP